MFSFDFESIPNKMHYLTSISKAFKLENVPYEDQLDSLINNFREKNNVPVLLYDNNFPAFFFNNIPFISLSLEKVIFKYSETEYIFKYKDNFQIDNQVREILLIYNLNRINLFNQGDSKYIYVFESKERHYVTNYQKEYLELTKNYSFVFCYYMENDLIPLN